MISEGAKDVPDGVLKQGEKEKSYRFRGEDERSPAFNSLRMRSDRRTLCGGLRNNRTERDGRQDNIERLSVCRYNRLGNGYP